MEPKRLKFDSTVEENICTVKDAVGALKGRSLETCVMLECMVPGSLGPGIDERDELQAEAVEMIGRVLERQEGELSRDLHRKEDMVQDPNRVRADMTAELQEAKDHEVGADQQVQRGQQDLKSAKVDAGTGQRLLASARSSHDKSCTELKQLEAEQAALELNYKDHFIPVRDGTWQTQPESAKHVAALLPTFKTFEYEDSLIAAFQKAADHKPPARGNFDNITMETAEKDFSVGLQHLVGKIGAAHPIVSQASDSVAEAASQLDSAKHHEREAALALGAALVDKRHARFAVEKAQKGLDEFPKDPKAIAAARDAARQSLKDFQEGPLAAFKSLRDRVAALGLS